MRRVFFKSPDNSWCDAHMGVYTLSESIKKTRPTMGPHHQSPHTITRTRTLRTCVRASRSPDSSGSGEQEQVESRKALQVRVCVRLPVDAVRQSGASGGHALTQLQSQ